MKLNINVFYSSVLFILIVICSIEYHNSNVLESRMNSLNKNSIDFNSEKTFKEDYYITQQSRDTNMLLLVFSALLGITGILTYRSITSETNVLINEMDAKYQKQKAENDSYHNDLVLLESELNFQIGLIYSDKAENLFNSDFNLGLMMSFCSMEKFALVLLSNGNEERKQESLKLLNFRLKLLNSKIKDSDLFRVVNLDFNIYKDRIARISKVLYNDETKIFHRITSKIEIT
jgi:hypothetical protein